MRIASAFLFKFVDCRFACLIIVQVVAHMSWQVERKICCVTSFKTNVSFLTTQNTSKNTTIKGQIENSNQYYLENESFQKFRTIFL